MIKCRVQIFDKVLEYSQTPQVHIIYVIIELYNFIKIYPSYSIDIFHNTKVDDKRKTK